MKVLNIGMLGFGMAGRIFHAPIIKSLPCLNLAKVASSNKSTAELIGKLYPNTKVVVDANLILEDKDIDIIVVATPNTSHVEYATKALEANKHVIVEKPFTITAAEADKLIKLAKEKNLVLSVHQNRRWDSDFLTVKKVIDSNLLGELVEYEAHYYRFRNLIKENSWREEAEFGSGVLYDLGSHLIDQALSLFGLPLEVSADLRVQRRHGKATDYFHLVLNYDKLRVVLRSGSLVREPLPHFILSGNEGSFVKYGMDVQEAALKAGITPNQDENWGVEPVELHGTINTSVNGLHIRGIVESERGDYRRYYENVYNAILDKEELIVKPEEARNTIHIIELAMESNAKKQRIKLDGK